MKSIAFIAASLWLVAFSACSGSDSSNTASDAASDCTGALEDVGSECPKTYSQNAEGPGCPFQSVARGKSGDLDTLTIRWVSHSSSCFYLPDGGSLVGAQSVKDMADGSCSGITNAGQVPAGWVAWYGPDCSDGGH